MSNLFETYSLDQLRDRTSEKWRFYGPDVLPLWVAEMDVPVADSVRAELEQIVALGDTGYDSAADEQRYIAAYHDFAARRWGANLGVSHARTTVDVISGIRAIIIATLGRVPAPAGSQALFEGTVIVQTPIYPPFLHRLPADYTLECAPLDASGHTDFAGLETIFKKVAGTPAVFALCSPHNPTGTVFDRDELTRIAQLCSEYDVQLISDEIHAPIVLEKPGQPAFVPILSIPEASSAIVSISASKGFSLPGFKAALLIPGTGGRAADLVDGLTQLDVHTGAHVASKVHAAAFEGGDDWLDQMVAGLATNEEIFRHAVSEQLPQARVVKGNGTYLAFLDMAAYFQGTAWDGKASEAILEGARVAFNDGATFGGPRWGNCVRVNIATNPAIITEAVTRVAKFVKSL